MPRVEVEEGHEEIKAKSGPRGDDKVGEDIITHLEGCFGVFELGDDDIESRESGVGHDDGIYDKTGHEHFFRPATYMGILSR